ncbi:hypothetical protein JCM10450v2_006638 [Rhodotorula kratochvilovae]
MAPPDLPDYPTSAESLVGRLERLVDEVPSFPADTDALPKSLKWLAGRQMLDMAMAVNGTFIAAGTPKTFASGVRALVGLKDGLKGIAKEQAIKDIKKEFSLDEMDDEVRELFEKKTKDKNRKRQSVDTTVVLALIAEAMSKSGMLSLPEFKTALSFDLEINNEHQAKAVLILGLATFWFDAKSVLPLLPPVLGAKNFKARRDWSTCANDDRTYYFFDPESPANIAHLFGQAARDVGIKWKDFAALNTLFRSGVTLPAAKAKSATPLQLNARKLCNRMWWLLAKEGRATTSPDDLPPRLTKVTKEHDGSAAKVQAANGHCLEFVKSEVLGIVAYLTRIIKEGKSHSSIDMAAEVNLGSPFCRTPRQVYNYLADHRQHFMKLLLHRGLDIRMRWTNKSLHLEGFYHDLSMPFKLNHPSLDWDKDEEEEDDALLAADDDDVIVIEQDADNDEVIVVEPSRAQSMGKGKGKEVVDDGVKVENADTALFDTPIAVF